MTVIARAREQGPEGHAHTGVRLSSSWSAGHGQTEPARIIPLPVRPAGGEPGVAERAFGLVAGLANLALAGVLWARLTLEGDGLAAHLWAGEHALPAVAAWAAVGLATLGGVLFARAIAGRAPREA